MTNLHSTSREIQTIHLIAPSLILISKQSFMDIYFVGKNLWSKVIENTMPKQLTTFPKMSELLPLGSCISLFLAK